MLARLTTTVCHKTTPWRLSEWHDIEASVPRFRGGCSRGKQERKRRKQNGGQLLGCAHNLLIQILRTFIQYYEYAIQQLILPFCSYLCIFFLQYLNDGFLSSLRKPRQILPRKLNCCEKGGRRRLRESRPRPSPSGSTSDMLLANSC